MMDGKNIVIEFRYEGKQDRAAAANLVRLKVDVIVTAGAGATRSAKRSKLQYDSSRYDAGFRSR